MIKYECGCIALSPAKGERGAQIVRPCDGGEHSSEYCLFLRGQVDKKFEELDSNKECLLFEDLAQLVADGYKFRELRALLK